MPVLAQKTPKSMQKTMVDSCLDVFCGQSVTYLLLRLETEDLYGGSGQNSFKFRLAESSGDVCVMKYVKITAFDCPDAWFQALSRIWNEGDVFRVGFGSEETQTKKLNLSIEIKHPENRPLVADKAPCDFKYVQGYALEYLWCGEKQDETYTYGSRLNNPYGDSRHPINQIEEAVERYVEEQNDRQVTMVIRLPEDIKKYDEHHHKSEPPCLSLIDTEILEGKMHLTCYFRSWDAYAGLPANIAGLQLFNEAFVKEINSRGNLSLETGKLIFHSKNCHVYQRQFKLVEELLKPKTSDKKPRMAQTLMGAAEETTEK